MPGDSKAVLLTVFWASGIDPAFWIIKWKAKGIAMLYLTRKTNETIQIGDGITIKICRSVAGRVILGIEAPRDVPVWRGELLKRAEGKGERTSGRH